MILGPGGAGVSSVAAAAALRVARSHRSSRSPVVRPATGDNDTLLITVDRLSKTAGRLGVFRRDGEAVQVSEGLYLLSLDRLSLLEETWAQFSSILAEATARSSVRLPGMGAVTGVASGELIHFPGIEDFLLLRRVRDEATRGRWRRIVLDCSGGGDAMALLRAPTVLHQMINRLWPRHLRIAAAAERPVLAQVSAAVDTIDTDCLDVAELIRDPAIAAVTLVVTADDRGAGLLESVLATIDLMGVALRSVVLNHAGPPPGDLHTLPDDPHTLPDDDETAGDATAGDAATAAPDRVLRQMRSVLAPDEADGVRVHEVGTRPHALDKPARLRKLDIGLDEPSGHGHGSSLVRVRTLSGSGVDSRFEMAWRQRLPDPDSFGLGRAGDDLLVTVDGFRHPVRLPSVLRRCEAIDAHWDGERLRVVFAPDPAVWPVR
ncbi:ArsA family ATPase [Gordonia pseudamarae]|uniref:ArsA family ATPase n=1 Tax=Gordonia pseudamarae TaxID=2831662 RepID=A0ABX6IRH2_9ACTN|nr:ArsA-related P-loop ATPase [Gordonia sp. (in: high G+C Gram-positive bacteria)]MBD0022623.1 ArsA family ATPase [Gordonia sp. (in: high G+C Gram-positive bacteria)]QHN28696.1 ArsA family ATPase [Gordonia pseudamarae]QHN37570.1 ArsA family ATPase [Gordonia pseudamarae]